MITGYLVAFKFSSWTIETMSCESIRVRISTRGSQSQCHLRQLQDVWPPLARRLHQHVALVDDYAVQFVHHALLVQEPAERSRHCALWSREHDPGPVRRSLSNHGTGRARVLITDRPLVSQSSVPLAGQTSRSSPWPSRLVIFALCWRAPRSIVPYGKVKTA